MDVPCSSSRHKGCQVREITVHRGFASTSERLEFSIRILSRDAKESSTGQIVKLQS